MFFSITNAARRFVGAVKAPAPTSAALAPPSVTVNSSPSPVGRGTAATTQADVASLAGYGGDPLLDPLRSLHANWRADEFWETYSPFLGENATKGGVILIQREFMTLVILSRIIKRAEKKLGRPLLTDKQKDRLRVLTGRVDQGPSHWCKVFLHVRYGGG